MFNTRSGHRPNLAHSRQPAGGPDWLKYVPASVRGLVRSHLPAGLPDVGFTIGGAAPLPHAAAARATAPAGAQSLSRPPAHARTSCMCRAAMPASRSR